MGEQGHKKIADDVKATIKGDDVGKNMSENVVVAIEDHLTTVVSTMIGKAEIR